MSAVAQPSIDKFMITGKKPSMATRKASETKPLIKPTPSSTSSGISSNGPTSPTSKSVAAATTAAINSNTSTISTLPKTSPTKPKQKQLKPIPKPSPTATSSSSSSFPSPNKPPSTPSTPVKRRAVIFPSKKMSPSPSSPARVKPTTYFGLLPPPVLSTINHNSEDSSPLTKNTAVKARPGSSVSQSPFYSAPTHAGVKKMVRIGEPIPESKDALATFAKRTTLSSSSALVARNTVANTLNSAAIDTKAPLTEDVSPQILKTKSSLKELNPATGVAATTKTRSETPAATTNISSNKSSTSKSSPVVPTEISGRVIKIKSSLPAKSNSTSTTAPKTAAVTSSGTGSSEVKKRVSKPTKAPPILPDTKNATQAASKPKSHLPVPKISIVAPVKPKIKPKPSNSSSKMVDLGLSATTATASAATIVPKNKTASKDATTSSPSKCSTTPKAPRSSSAITTTSPTTITNPSSKDNNTPASKLSKSLTISTAAFKTKAKDKEKDTLPQATATTALIGTTEDIPWTHPPDPNHSDHHINSRHFPPTSTATNTPLHPLPASAPTSHLQPYHFNITGSNPRPKRLLELDLQEKCENCNTLHINENDSPYYYHHSHHFLCRNPLHPTPKEQYLAQIRDSSRPQKRQRISDVSNSAAIAGKSYEVFGQTAFEQALATMSFKHPTFTSYTKP
ncbi:hypothetical protein BGZ96_007816 [Linnemannia gamsii]|uniref:Uncharacterized protein n=1 Tax=Linnemannia gamsii TaxID=64522 RepID=A0ABQ7K0Q4_9FUNG|nr:hypothetical protein BGZ96_007816 [Linnemannia gamsii]